MPGHHRLQEYVDLRQRFLVKGEPVLNEWQARSSNPNSLPCMRCMCCCLFAATASGHLASVRACSGMRERALTPRCGLQASYLQPRAVKQSRSFPTPSAKVSLINAKGAHIQPACQALCGSACKSVMPIKCTFRQGCAAVD